MIRFCEVHVGRGAVAATHRATYDPDRFPTKGKFRFDLCPTHAQQALVAGAVVTQIKEA